ncbi:MAG: peptidoglycan DD-metalloendopeptidase family protein [Desulfobacterales bacterium]
MRKKLTFIILSNGGSRVRQLSASQLSLVAVAMIFLIGATAFGLLARDYFSLKRTLNRQASIQHSLAAKEAEIEFHQKQIASFADEINTLKARLLALNDFEKKIRIIANLEVKEDDDNLYGVGGSPLDDIDATAQMKKDQAAMLREMHRQVEHLDVASALQAESFDSLLDSLEDQKNLLASTPSIRPAAGWISSSFGNRTSPFTGRKEFHPALDIANRDGTPIVTSADGVVRFAGKKGLLGNLVVVDHGHGLVTRYAHLSEPLVKNGEKLRRGDVIGKMGSTGRSTGPHVHYEIRLNGVPVNPSNYILN